MVTFGSSFGIDDLAGVIWGSGLRLLEEIGKFGNAGEREKGWQPCWEPSLA